MGKVKRDGGFGDSAREIGHGYGRVGASRIVVGYGNGIGAAESQRGAVGSGGELEEVRLSVLIAFHDHRYINGRAADEIGRGAEAEADKVSSAGADGQV